MRENIMSKEDLKVLFKSLKKPTGGDFAELIDFAETIIEFFAHSSTGTGTISENVNASVTIDNEYGEVHMVQSYDGMYLFSELDRGTYGKNGVATNDAQFIHISPRPDIINDDYPSDTQTYSSQYIEDNFMDESEAQAQYVSKVITSEIDDANVDILSSGEIRASNIINAISYINGQLLMSKGRPGEIQNYALAITPDVTVRFHNVPPGGQAHNIVADFNAYANNIGLAFIKGDVVVLNYDLSHIDDGQGNKLGIYVYMIKKEFPFSNPPVTQIDSETGDLINFTPVNLHSILSDVYTKAEVDQLISAASQGITGTVATYADLTSVPTPAEGEQWIVETYTAGEGGAPADGSTGVFQHNSGAWTFVYSLQYDHTHAYTDITGINWLGANQSDVYVGDFGQDDQAQTVTLAEKNQMATNTTNIGTNQTDIAANTTAIGTKEDDLGVPTVNDQVLTSLTDGTRQWATPPQGVTEFIALSDTPVDYGTSGQVLKSNGSAVIWGTDDSGAGTPTWGDIEGTLSAQTDLQAELDAKAGTGHNHDATYAPKSHTHSGVYEPVLGDPSTSGYILSSTIDGIRSWVPPATGGSETIWGSITGNLVDQTDLNTALNGKEPGLGNPTTDGHILSSTAAGARSWIAPPSAPPAADPVPSGVICMWSTSAAIPTGWSVCDGNNGTPDLTGVFVRGGNSSTVGDTGGSDDAVVVSHGHSATFTGTALPTHSHEVEPSSNIFKQPDSQDRGYGNDNDNWGGNDPTHTDAVTAGTPSGTVSVTDTGVSGVGANIPAYYTLIYIMKD